MRSSLRPFLVCLSLLIVMMILNLGIGSVTIPPLITLKILFSKLLGQTGNWPEMYETILEVIRLPHMVLIALTGAALAGSGAAYQGLFRNPLADPYLMGIAAGAGLGAVLAMAIFMPSGETQVTGLTRLYLVPLMAFIGALITVAVVYALSMAGGASQISNLILAGVAIGSFASALTSFLMLRSQGDLHRALAWLLGGATMGGWGPVWVILPYIALGLGILAFSGHVLNVLQFGEEQAHQLGLPVRRARLLLIGAASLATAAAVAFSGLIGFLGLMIPHLVRMVWGADYRRVVGLAILVGASALLLADILARVILAPQQLPLGIVTALAGAPFFLWVLLRTRTRSEM